MNLEQQVVSLDIAKRLEQLGVKQNSLFYWSYSNIGGEETYYLQYFEPCEGGYDTDGDYSAFTVAELGEMLPKLTNSFREPGGEKERWCCTRNEPSVMISHHANTEADARGKMLIYLLENKLLIT